MTLQVYFYGIWNMPIPILYISFFLEKEDDIQIFIKTVISNEVTVTQRNVAPTTT
jgi:hypothetical protein